MVQWTSQCAAELNVWLWTALAVFCSKPAGTQLTTTPSPRESASNQERLTSAHCTQAKKNSKVSNLGICIWWCLIFWISKLVRFPKSKKIVAIIPNWRQIGESQGQVQMSMVQILSMCAPNEGRKESLNELLETNKEKKGKNYPCTWSRILRSCLRERTF